MRQVAKCECARWPNSLRPNKYKHDDEKYINLNIVLDVKDFGLTLMKKSTIKLDQLRFIDKTRIVKVERKLISKTLKNLLEKKIHSLFSM